MPINGYTYLCQANQKIIVSKDRRESREHRALNNSLKAISYYRVDGVIIRNGKKCDFLLLDEECKIAYFIELKGDDLCEAARQIDLTQIALANDLKDYKKRYRIVASKCRTTEIGKSSFRKFQVKWGSSLVYKTNVLEECI